MYPTLKVEGGSFPQKKSWGWKYDCGLCNSRGSRWKYSYMKRAPKQASKKEHIKVAATKFVCN